MQNAAQPTSGGFYDVFVTKLNPSGSALAYSTYLGGTGLDGGRGIAVDSLDNAYIAGQTASNNFPTTLGTYQTTSGGGDYDAFVTKINTSGSLVYSTYLGGSGNDLGLGIAVDFLGNAYVAGVSASPDFPTTAGAYQQVKAGDYDAYVVKIAAANVGKITGGGSIFDAGNTGTVGFTVQRASAAAPIQGDLQYINRATGTKIHSVAFNSLSINATRPPSAGRASTTGLHAPSLSR